MIQMIDKREMEKQGALIKDRHSSYLKTNPEMAASYPCCSYLLALYDTIKPKRILELGSGISSYCLRLFKKENNLDTEIYSIDTSKLWLSKAIEYCKLHQLDISNFFTWDQFKDYQGTFDLIFVDIDNSTNRYLYFQPIFDQFSKKGTIILFDDMHKGNISNPFQAIIKGREYAELDISDLTTDEYNRFSKLIRIE